MNGAVELLNPRPRDAQRTLPISTHNDTGCVYVVEYDTGWIKVGYATRVASRISDHISGHPLAPHRVIRVWVSPPIPRYRDVEQQLIARAQHTSVDRAKHEYFLGCKYADLVEVAQQPLPPALQWGVDTPVVRRPRPPVKTLTPPAKPTASQRTATLLLKRPVESWIRERRTHTPWRTIAAELGVATNGMVAVRHETLRTWAPDPAAPPPIPLPRHAARPATITRTVRALRSAHQVDAGELARRLGISRQSFYNRLNDGHWLAADVAALADYFGCTIQDLYDGAVDLARPTAMPPAEAAS